MSNRKELSAEEKLHIAREAYKAVKSVVDSVESYLDARVRCCWDECITVDDEFFQGDDFREVVIDETAEKASYGKPISREELEEYVKSLGLSLEEPFQPES
jgi:hypothetical protein